MLVLHPLMLLMTAIHTVIRIFILDHILLGMLGPVLLLAVLFHIVT